MVCRLSEVNGKRRLEVRDVHTVDEALRVLEGVVNVSVTP